MKKLIVAGLFIPIICQAEFFTGNDLLTRLQSSSIVERSQALGYIQGVFDVYMHVTICPPQGGTTVTAGQIQDMVRSYLEANPSIRHRNAEALINDSLKQFWPCRNRNGV